MRANPRTNGIQLAEQVNISAGFPGESLNELQRLLHNVEADQGVAHEIAGIIRESSELFAASMKAHPPQDAEYYAHNLDGAVSDLKSMQQVVEHLTSGGTQ